MKTHLPDGWRRTRGFTLIELLVTILIVAVLAAIAYPSYINQSRHSRRTEAKTALLDFGGREERNYSTNNAYTNLPASLGYAGAFPLAVGNGYYTVNVVVTAGAANVPATYTVTATAVGDQANDTPCTTFTYTQAGAQASADNLGNDTTPICWR